MDIEQLRRPLLYPVAETGRVVTQRNLVYRDDCEDWLQMDVYVPSDLSVETRLAGVVFIHGGPIPASLPLYPKDWGVFRSYGALAASSGFIGITFNHRFFNACAYGRFRGAAIFLDPFYTIRHRSSVAWFLTMPSSTYAI